MAWGALQRGVVAMPQCYPAVCIAIALEGGHLRFVTFALRVAFTSQMAESLSSSLSLSSSHVYLFRMIVVAVLLLCLGSTAFAAPATSTSDNPRALLPRGRLQKREPICLDASEPKPSAANCDHAIANMPITFEAIVASFGGTFSGILIGNPFRLPRYFPYKDCMVEVDMKSRDVVEDLTSWNDIAKKAIDILHACVQGPTHQHGGTDVVGSRSAIEIRLSWNFPEMDTLASLNRPEQEGKLDLHTPDPEEQLPAPRIVGKPPLPPPSGRRKRPRPEDG